MDDKSWYLQLSLVPAQNTRNLRVGPQKMQITNKVHVLPF